MAKAAVLHYSCSECGYSTGRWLGRCPSCASFGTLAEEGPPPGTSNGNSAAPRPLLKLAEVEANEADRIPTGVAELDRVLGGGLVPASLVLVGGEPGVGKSTLLLSALASISKERRALLVTGEESPAQVKLRAARLGGAESVEILAETNLDSVCATLETERPDVCVIDSIQTLYAAEVSSAPGSVSQVREAAARLLRVAKESGVALFLVGHVTKDGSVAGPRVLEHLVDCVLQFEGDRYHAHRILRAVKNRFGSTNELGVFEMTGTGLEGVPDPSELFGRSTGEVGSAVGCALEGTRPLLLEVQALVAPTDLAMPRRVGTGVDPKRLAMIVAVLSRHAGLSLGQADVFVNVAGGVRIDEPGADLAVAMAIASAARGAPVREGVAAFGEIGLTGRLRPAAQAERRLEECAKFGVNAVVVPAGTKGR
ncbi:MAG: DNA repair protein RadA, partial [Gaiellaceae bacterium]